MKVLQISNDFVGSKVHRNLFECLDKLGVEQTIYCPVRDTKCIGANQFVGHSASFIYSNIIQPWYKFVYHLKANRIYQDLRKKVSPRCFDLIHAASLFSDGIQAYKIYKAYGVPYIVAVRSTDVNDFLSIAPHTWRTGRKILINASKIVFISPALKSRFCQHKYIKTFLSRIVGKIFIQPNGIDNYWIDNVNRGSLPDNHNVLYVGTFLKRKNPVLLIRAILDLARKYADIKLNIVGSTGEEEAEVLRYVQQYPEILCYHGQINERHKLLECYRSNTLFVLPSIHETFGLVYLEALSQNLPVVYVRGDGIDGLLTDDAGIGIDAPGQESIKKAIITVFENRSSFSNYNYDFEQYRWIHIARHYMDVYKSITNPLLSNEN